MSIPTKPGAEQGTEVRKEFLVSYLLPNMADREEVIIGTLRAYEIEMRAIRKSPNVFRDILSATRTVKTTTTPWVTVPEEKP